MSITSGGGEKGEGVGRKLAWGGFLAELVSLIRDDLLDTNVQEFEGRHVMAGDKDKEQTYRGPLTRPLQPAVQKDMTNDKRIWAHVASLLPLLTYLQRPL